jgi:hypothetical protein
VDESLPPRLGQCGRISTRLPTIECPPQPQCGRHSDFEEPIERQKSRNRISGLGMQMQPQVGAEVLDDVLVTFIRPHGLKRQRPRLGL